jgi:rubrerythrin
MSEHHKEMLDAIMRAMEIEKETFDFYTRAEQKTFNPAGKRIFRWLAKSEEVHYLKMSELYNSLNTGGRWVFYGGSTISLEPEGEGEKGVRFDTDDREALEIALGIEKKAISYFEELERNTTDPEGKSMFRTLIAEEQEHHRIITGKYQALMLA